MEKRNLKNTPRAGTSNGESRTPSEEGVCRAYTGAAQSASSEAEAAKAARQKAILAALGGDDNAKKRDSPKPTPITAPAAELLTDEDVDFSQPQPNGVERMLRLMQRKKLRGDRDLPRVLLTRDVKMPPPSTGNDSLTGRDSPRGRVSQHGSDSLGRDSEDWLSDSSEMSGMSLDSEGLPALTPDRTHRKRRNTDEDMAPPLSKGVVPKSKKGRGRPPTTGQYVGLAKAQADYNKEKAESIKLQAEAEVAESVRAVKEARESLLRASPAPKVGESEQTNAALIQSVEVSLEAVTTVATKSQNLKGTFVRALKEAVVSIRAAVTELKGRSMSEEMKRLEEQNARLQQQVTDLRQELQELRRQPPAPAGKDLQELLAEVSRSNVETFGNMLNARLAGLEDRLLPEPRRRPPLAADNVDVPPPEEREKTPKRTVTASQVAPAAQELPAAEAKKKKKKKRPSMAAQEAAQRGAHTSSLPNEAQWTTIVSKGQKKKKEAPTPSKAASEKTKKKKRKARIRNPATAAVTLTLGASAAEQGLTYSKVLLEARSKINLAELNISRGVRIRKAQTGARIIAVGGEGAMEKADALAAMLKDVLNCDQVKVARPIPCAEIRVAGLDDSVTAAEVIEAVAREGGCSADQIRSGPAAECGAAEPNCSLCEAAGKVERGHVLGRCPSAKKPAPGEEKAPSKKARQKPKPKGKRAPPVSAAMEMEA
ncbi:uncharacterized protein LOC121733957 [Aricia agestis]|uniref:uncharacterized protein LOC121733957 n=1 Tax=Aricia agestis TaxID=91739 RepID=UPI001C205C6B|nr:uncharacterized protein LOC121733957 [Aricia agestis]